MNDLGASIFCWTSSAIVTNSCNFSNIGDSSGGGFVGGNYDSDGGGDDLEIGRYKM